jgi:cytidyltransferase-like protein
MAMQVDSKIKNLDVLSQTVTRLRMDGKRIVHCHGVFDLMHIGHIRHFRQAAAMGDVLVVTITPDRHVDKGPDRPAFNEQLRAEAIAALDCVHFVSINNWPTAEETLRVLRPDVYVKGAEFRNTKTDRTGKAGLEENVCDELGTEMLFTDDIVYSSSNLLNRYLSAFPEDVNRFLAQFRTLYSLDDILAVVEQMATLRVLVVGDTILDEYQYCDVMGKSSKDPILAARLDFCERFAGGALAVANHVSNFVAQVRLASVLGENERHEEFVRSKLHANVDARFFTQRNAPTVLKRRFLERYSLNKLFEIYVMDDAGLTQDEERAMSDWLRQATQDVDLVISADFGHGAISSSAITLLTELAPFLAVNTQANAGNRGFHTITRYPRADFACLAEHEVRLEMRAGTGEIEQMLPVVANRITCPRFVITRGKNGSLLRDQAGVLTQVPGFAHDAVDRVGAGDAFFSIAALAAALRVPNDMLGFLGMPWERSQSR